MSASTPCLQGQAAPAYVVTPTVTPLGSEYLITGLGCGVLGVHSLATGRYKVLQPFCRVCRTGAFWPVKDWAGGAYHKPSAFHDLHRLYYFHILPAGQLIRELSLGMPTTSPHFAALDLFTVSAVQVSIQHTGQACDMQTCRTKTLGPVMLYCMLETPLT
jgi:hypothetical protein